MKIAKFVESILWETFAVHHTDSVAPPVAIIMAGGAGTRFWPVSKRRYPKQFLSLCSERSLLQECFDRLQGIVAPERILVLTNEDFIPLVHEQLPEIPAEHVIGEPCRRDTAGAVALGSLLAQHLFGDCTLITLASDPCISPTDLFQQTIISAINGARQAPNSLYTVGIVPTYAAVSYGYLHRGERLEAPQNIAHYRLQDFREKPDLATAQSYLASGEYFWNSGIFIWQSSAIIDEMQRHIPEHLQTLTPVMSSFGTPQWRETLATAFAKLQRISIDFAVMEKADNVRTVEAKFSWYDVGNWLALEPFLASDKLGNHHRGQLEAYDSEHNIVFNTNPDTQIALVGVKDLVVVQSGRHTLIVGRDNLEDVKKLIASLPDDDQ